MKVSRAAFLKAAGTALLGARVDARTLLGPVAVASSPPEVSPVATPGSAGRLLLADATAVLFLPHLYSEFAVQSASGVRAQMLLAKVLERPVTRNVEQFSLIFQTRGGETLHDGTHAVRHPVLGDFDLFIVPVGAPKGRLRVYQACFSRHLS